MFCRNYFLSIIRHHNSETEKARLKESILHTLKPAATPLNCADCRAFFSLKRSTCVWSNQASFAATSFFENITAINALNDCCCMTLYYRGLWMESYTCVVCEPCSSEALNSAFTLFYVELYFDTFKRGLVGVVTISIILWDHIQW